MFLGGDVRLGVGRRRSMSFVSLIISLVYHDRNEGFERFLTGVGGDLWIRVYQCCKESSQNRRNRVFLFFSSRGTPRPKVRPFAQVDTKDDIGLIVSDRLVDMSRRTERPSAVLLDQSPEIRLRLVRSNKSRRIFDEGRDTLSESFDASLILIED